MLLQREFFERDPLTCARALIGQELVAGPCAGIIVETEAYCAAGDEACHTFFRPSTREFMSVHDPGAAYVYLNYGMYWLLNVLVKGGGGGAEDGFVLIRALEPVVGIELMRERRGRHALHQLCSGPGKLTQALGITGAEHGVNLCEGPIGFRPRLEHPQVETALRVGITKAAHLPWRYLLKGSPFISAPTSSL
ncbi:MAG: DNA-3-methyladenine glycosylase [Chthoniobacteraceae bacterium]|nr:DNA-3-methyladenine glycosylase [Chthoniobacteraceae bacterium]